jgi:hypothetical protein
MDFAALIQSKLFAICFIKGDPGAPEQLRQHFEMKRNVNN